MAKENKIYLINEEFKKDKIFFVKRIAKLIKKIKTIGFAGYDSRIDLEKNLDWQIFGKDSPGKDFAFDKKKIKELTEKALKKCLKRIDELPYIFIFPSHNKFTNEKMGGVGGNSPKYHVILIFVNTSIKDWEHHLEETICHEFAHALSPHYDPWENTIGEGIILDGLAENFQEDVLKERKSMFSEILTEDECKKILIEIEPKLGSKDSKEYNRLFYGGGKYKPWTGYAMGYWLVKRYLKTLEKIDWKLIINANPNEILEKIKKIL